MYSKHLHIFFLVIAIACSGCSKWLDINPKSRVSERVLFEDEQGFKDALIGAYIQMASRELYAKEMTMGFMDVLAANYDVTGSSDTYFQAGNYNYSDAQTQLRINNIWNRGYQVIANLNNILEAIDGQQALFTGNNYQQIKGEALALRAFLHFDLLRIFGPVPEAGLHLPSIPYVTLFDMDIKPVLSAQRIIDHCLADLEEAISLLAVNKDVVYGGADVFLSYTRNRMNYWAATGLMARIALYAGNKPMAYTKAKEIIQSDLFPFVRSQDISTSSSPDRIFSMEHLFSLYVSNLTDINAELFKSTAGVSLLTATDAQINERFDIASGGSTDYRYLFLWQTEGASSIKYPAKYWQDNVTHPNLVNRVPLIRLSEMYYIAAESTTQPDESVTLLNTVRQHRGLHSLPEPLDGNQLEEELFKEYKKEFYQEGQLFFYYKRKNKSNIDGYQHEVTPVIYVLPMPDDEKEFNPSTHESN